MTRKIIEVLKGDQIRFSGTVHLATGGIAPGGAAMSGRTNNCKSNAAAQVQQARIVESNNEYAILEITCGCGSKSHIQCNYADIAQSQPEKINKSKKQQSK